ncbi:chorismate mutase aro7 [Perkinsus olseni]|uniref:chorismate mutase n=3 Tax=Perkinsus olseni TaxID=32597 RepID=A0A7J6NVY3_PEROL|nr:chorismate mutase aro7 [Perkinsus olseni]
MINTYIPPRNTKCLEEAMKKYPQIPMHSAGRPQQQPQPLQLADLRSDLIRQEETVIFALIERAQYKQNLSNYARCNEIGTCSKLDYFLTETEKLHSRFRRYDMLEEPFTNPKFLPAPLFSEAEDSPQRIVPNTINANSRLKSFYIKNVIPLVCRPGEEESSASLGASVVRDVTALQAMSRRIHYGKLVAEAKFQANTELYSQLIRAQDADGLMDLLTDSAVEEKLLLRVREKARAYGRDIKTGGSEAAVNDSALKVDPDTVVLAYRELMIPLTKEVQVAYLLRRLDSLVIAVTAGWARVAAVEYTTGNPLNSSPRAINAKAHAAELKVHDSVKSVFDDVASGAVSFGVVPLDSSVTGVDIQTLGALIDSHRPNGADLVVCDQISLQPSYAVISQPVKSGRPIPLTKASRVITTSMASEYCRGQISEVPGIKIHLVDTYFEAVEKLIETVKEDPKAVAVIPTPYLYEMIEDYDQDFKSIIIPNADLDNVKLQFGILRRPLANSSATGSDRTLIAFNVNHRHGSLMGALDCFRSSQVNLSSLHSFPASTGFDFVAIADGHPDDKQTQDALALLTGSRGGNDDRPNWAKVLGCFHVREEDR